MSGITLTKYRRAARHQPTGAGAAYPVALLAAALSFAAALAAPQAFGQDTVIIGGSGKPAVEVNLEVLDLLGAPAPDGGLTLRHPGVTEGGIGAITLRPPTLERPATVVTEPLPRETDEQIATRLQKPIPLLQPATAEPRMEGTAQAAPAPAPALAKAEPPAEAVISRRTPEVEPQPLRSVPDDATQTRRTEPEAIQPIRVPEREPAATPIREPAEPKPAATAAPEPPPLPKAEAAPEPTAPEPMAIVKETPKAVVEPAPKPIVERETVAVPEPPVAPQPPTAPEPVAAAAQAPEPVAQPAAPAAEQEVAALTPVVVPLAPGAMLRVEFQPENADLPQSIKDKLAAVARQLKDDSSLRLQLKAYAGGTAESASQARRLSLSRALAVRAHLIEEGLRSTRIDVRALGNRAEEGPSERVDVIVIKR